MSYSLVEAEILALAQALLSAEVSPELHANLDRLFEVMQTGMERHIFECQGIVRALMLARDRLYQGTQSQ